MEEFGMNKFIFCGALVLALTGCSQKLTNQVGKPLVSSYQVVKPLPSVYPIEKLKNVTVAASFSAKDFSWKEGLLSMEVYTEDLYDAALISKLKAGDTLVYLGQPIVVRTVNVKDGFVTVNGGIEEGGADLMSNNGGTYRGTQLDDHSTYTKLGKVTLPLRKDFLLIDCGVNPDDPYDTIKVAQETYLKKVKEYKRYFSPLNTKVLIKQGSIVSIIRRWIP